MSNNFNLIRLIAALAVIWSHSYPIGLGPGNHDALRWYFGHEVGRLAVDVFFVVSGYLITKSAARSSSIVVFSVNRLLRIYPGLWACLFLTGAFYLFSASGALADSLSEASTYFGTNALLVRGAIDFSLAGAFEENPMRSVVNGSLWTLPWELRMYALVACIYFFAARWRRVGVVGVLVVGLVIDIAARYQVTDFPLIVPLVGRFVCTFFIGAFFAEFLPSWRPPMKFFLAALGAAVGLGLLGQPLPYFLYVVFLPLVVFGVAFSIPSPNRLRQLTSTDVSYGVYLYGFPIQQLIASAYPGISPTAMTLAAIPLALAMGWASYKLVEAPALACKPWLLARVSRLPMLGGRA